jgi:hypothetical protein
MKLYVYWTYTRPEDRLVATEVLEYARKKPKLDTPTYHIGGLGHKEDLFTHFLDREGKIHVLRPQTEIHLAIHGGVNGEHKYVSNPSVAQLHSLANLFKLVKSLKWEIIEGDMLEFDLEFWKTAINLWRI